MGVFIGTMENLYDLYVNKVLLSYVKELPFIDGYMEGSSCLGCWVCCNQCLKWRKREARHFTEALSLGSLVAPRRSLSRFKIFNF